MVDRAEEREAGLVGRRVADRGRGAGDGDAAVRVTVKALPGTAWVWSRFSDQVTVTVVPSAATVAELSVGAVVSTVKERTAEKEEPAAAASTFFARQ